MAKKKFSKASKKQSSETIAQATTTAAAPAESKSAKTLRSKYNYKKNSLAKEEFVMGTKNYIIMGVGILFLIVGFLLMISNTSDDMNVFDESVIYGFRVLTLAPIIVILGFIIEAVAIMYPMDKPANHQPDTAE